MKCHEKINFFVQILLPVLHFGRLCNQVLPKTLRFSLQRQKAPEFGFRRILGLYAGFLFYQRLVPKLQKAALFAIVCRFSLWNSARCFRIQRKLNSGLWLGAFGKVWLFRCQSGIRGLWLGAFGKKRFFRCQSTPGPPYAVSFFCNRRSGALAVHTLLKFIMGP